MSFALCDVEGDVWPLCAVAVLLHPQRCYRRLMGLLPFAALGAAYFAMIYLARDSHLHFHDGTFSLGAPFLETIARSMGGMLKVWGVLFLPVLIMRTGRPWRNLAFLGLLWMLLSLLPYSFLTYMPRVPSRHTYIASVGKSMVLAAGLLALREYARKSNRVWMIPSAIALILIHQFGYLWLVKQYQYSNRAEPTEELVRVAQASGQTVHASCFPYTPIIADLALRMRFHENPPKLFAVGPVAARQPDAVDFCNNDANGVHY